MVLCKNKFTFNSIWFWFSQIIFLVSLTAFNVILFPEQKNVIAFEDIIYLIFVSHFSYVAQDVMINQNKTRIIKCFWSDKIKTYKYIYIYINMNIWHILYKIPLDFHLLGRSDNSL